MGASLANRPGAGASLLLIGSLVNAACGVSTTAPTAVEPTLNLTGRYTLTLRPSERCVTFPDSVQTVRFTAALNQQESAFSLAVQITLGGIQYPITLHGSVHANELSFATADCVRFKGEAFKSDVSANETFGMCGSSVATIANPRHITGLFNGTFEYYVVDEMGRMASATECSAPDHAVTLDSA
jgi:hypothetical protein